MRAMAGGICKSRKGGGELCVLYSASQHQAGGESLPQPSTGPHLAGASSGITTFVCVRMWDHGQGSEEFYIASDPCVM